MMVLCKSSVGSAQGMKQLYPGKSFDPCRPHAPSRGAKSGCLSSSALSRRQTSAQLGGASVSGSEIVARYPAPAIGWGVPTLTCSTAVSACGSIDREGQSPLIGNSVQKATALFDAAKP